MEIDHIGYAVKNIEKAKASFEKLGYSFEEVITDEKRGIDICFGNNGGYRIELVCPLSGFDAPVRGWLKKNGPSPYHICYKSDDFDADIENLRSQKFQVVVPPDSAIAFGGKKVVFMFQLQQGLLEIVEK